MSKTWVSLFKNKVIQVKGEHYRIVNASIAGETTGGGLSRLSDLIKRNKPNIIIIELGANDGLRGLPPVQIQKNLQKMIKISKKQTSKILLIGIQIPDNYGTAYVKTFFTLFSKVAKNNHVLLLPNLLEGIDDKPELFQDDGLHPNNNAQSLILMNVWKKFITLIN
ncbi:MAG: Esterase TesA [Legionellaceae bacterium]